MVHLADCPLNNQWLMNKHYYQYSGRLRGRNVQDGWDILVPDDI